jgi:integrase
MASRGDLKPRTLESYREMHARHLAPVFGGTPVRAITRAKVREFLRAQLGRYSRGTVRLMYATLHVVLEELTEDGLPANPVAGLSRKLKLAPKAKARREAVKVRAMTRGERDVFLATAERIEPWWAPAWTVQALTGLRPGELLALTDRDIDLERRTLRVERALADDGSDVGSTKTGERRDVDLSSEAVAVFRQVLARWKAEKLRRGWRETPPALFCSTAGTYADPSGVRQAFRRVCREAKLVTPEGRARFTPHGLRHTFAALHLQAGTDVYYVSTMLGHADIGLTVGTYGAWLKPDRRHTLDALDRLPIEPADVPAVTEAQSA